MTGGEPLVDATSCRCSETCPDTLETGALEELTLTTNGSQLDSFSDELADIGVRRINVSLDTLDDEKFAKITRWGRWKR